MAANELAIAVRDAYPVTRGHSLVIPKRHVTNWWSATQEERAAIFELVDAVKHGLDEECSPDGYNVGFNDGPAAGQTVFHLHMHVIPRYQGDVADPRGGVRHVVPERGNYLARQEESSPVVTGLETAMESSALIQRALAILDDGRRSATYKPALLLALVELAVERVDGTAALELPLGDIADRVMELYWQQTRPHESATAALRQATTKSSRIIDALIDLRRTTGVPTNHPLGRVQILYPLEYQSARRRVARALAKQPIPRLQRTGAAGRASSEVRFLYDDHDFIPEKGWRHPDRDPVVRLLPGVADALARSAPLLRMATQDVWVREVAAINRLKTQEQELRSFLFGADRVSLRLVTDGLRDLGERDCFWCAEPLRGAVEIDHVIPWSHYPNDDLFNLVLADRDCNNAKRDRLVTAGLVERWARRRQEPLRSLAVELDWLFDPRRSGRVASSAYRYLPEGMPVWASRDRVEAFTPEDRRRVEVAVGELVRAAS